MGALGSVAIFGNIAESTDLCMDTAIALAIHMKRDDVE